MNFPLAWVWAWVQAAENAPAVTVFHLGLPHRLFAPVRHSTPRERQRAAELCPIHWPNCARRLAAASSAAAQPTGGPSNPGHCCARPNGCARPKGQIAAPGQMAKWPNGCARPNGVAGCGGRVWRQGCSGLRGLHVFRAAGGKALKWARGWRQGAAQGCGAHHAGKAPRSRG